jgi:Ca2+-binding EF-hand superfamily protein
MFVGILYICIGRQTSKKLAELKKSMYSEATLRAEFREVDVENKGAITRAQFKNLLAALGIELNRRETETAFLDIDKNDNGMVTVEEFLAWWNGDDDAGFTFV